jgi:hypothetical protein
LPTRKSALFALGPRRLKGEVCDPQGSSDPMLCHLLVATAGGWEKPLRHLDSGVTVRRDWLINSMRGYEHGIEKS